MNTLRLEWVDEVEGDDASAVRELRARLDWYAVRYRYLGKRADSEEARFALRSAEAVRQFGRARLGLAI